MARSESVSGTTRHPGEAATVAPDRHDTARYIAALSAELSILARQVDLELLSYFLEMARMEAVAATSSSKRGRRKAASDNQLPAPETKSI